jgi:hypothetical protein
VRWRDRRELVEVGCASFTVSDARAGEACCWPEEAEGETREGGREAAVLGTRNAACNCKRSTDAANSEGYI